MSKSEFMKVRVDQEEKAAFGAAAKLAGLTASGWIRERLRLAAIRELEGAGQQVPFVRRIPMRRGTDG